MGFWVALGLWLGSFVLGRLFQPRLPKPQSAEPEKFDSITGDYGRPIPVLMGTRQFKAPNLGWFGDLSTTAIVQSGVTTGYKYYMGAMYAICMGLIDDIVDFRFNERSVGNGVSEGANAIRFGNGSVVTALIAPGNYSGGAALAAACEAAMKAAQPGDWRVTYGFTIVAGVNDQLKVQYAGFPISTVTLPVGKYDGAGLAVQIRNSLAAQASNPNGPLAWACSYSGFRFSITGQLLGYANWKLHPSNMLSTLGFQHNLIYTQTSDTVVGGYDVKANRFIFAFGGTTATLAVTDGAFTAATLLGLSTAADRTLGIYTSDSDFSVIAATYTDTTDYLQVDIDDAAFFGTEGGVLGRMDLFRGSASQVASDYLVTQFGGAAPAFRRLCYAVQRHMYVGNTNYPKPVSWTLRRCPNQLGLTNERHNIAGDANPACMIWELFTDLIWGCGLPEAQLDKAIFIVVGNALYDEGFGLSMIIDAAAPASEIIADILRHIDGVIYEDPETGLISIRLARNDYVVADLPLLDESNSWNGTLKRRSWEETRNSILVKYVSRARDYQEDGWPEQDLANIEIRGGDISHEDIPFPGISNEANAKVAARRALKALSSIPAEIQQLEVNREGWKLVEGAPFRFSRKAWGITDMPCRVTRVAGGTLSDSRLRIDAIQDIAGPAWTGFVTPTAPADDPAELPAIPSGSLGVDDTAFSGTAPIGP